MSPNTNFVRACPSGPLVEPRVEDIIDIVGYESWYQYVVEFRRLVSLCVYSANESCKSSSLIERLDEWSALKQPELVEFYIWKNETNERTICWQCGKTDLSHISPRRNRFDGRVLQSGGVCSGVLNLDPGRQKAVFDRVPKHWFREADVLIDRIRLQLSHESS